MKSNKTAFEFCSEPFGKAKCALAQRFAQQEESFFSVEQLKILDYVGHLSIRPFFKN